MIYICHYGVTQSYFYCPKNPLVSEATTNLFVVAIVLLFPECRVSGIMQYVAFADWLLSFSDQDLRFLSAISWHDNTFLFSAE